MSANSTRQEMLLTEEKKPEPLTMYIKNRRDSSKIKAFGSYQSLCSTESLVLRNRLLFIYRPLWAIKMKMIKNILFLLFGLVLFSCGNQQTNHSETEANSSDSVKTVKIDSFYIDESEINSSEWKEYKSDSTVSKSPMQVELDNALGNESIDKYYKEAYQQEKLISADDNKMLSITDSLFTNDTETDLFYFIVFTKSMNGSDGFYSEALGLSTFDFVTKKTEWFADYFNIAPKLTDQDMDNWAYYVYGEIQISRESEEEKAVKELEIQLLKNIEGNRKEYKVVIERFIEKIKKAHNNG